MIQSTRFCDISATRSPARGPHRATPPPAPRRAPARSGELSARHARRRRVRPTPACDGAGERGPRQRDQRIGTGRFCFALSHTVGAPFRRRCRERPVTMTPSFRRAIACGLLAAASLFVRRRRAGRSDRRRLRTSMVEPAAAALRSDAASAADRRASAPDRRTRAAAAHAGASRPDSPTRSTSRRRGRRGTPDTATGCRAGSTPSSATA